MKIPCFLRGMFGPNHIAEVRSREGKILHVPASESQILRSGRFVYLEVGVVSWDGNDVLVEFSQEAFSGERRIYVCADQIIEALRHNDAEA